MTKHEEIDGQEVWASIMEDDWAAQRQSREVAKTVRQIKRHGVEHDYQDVLEFEVGGVLSRFYGLSAPQTREAAEELHCVLLAMGGKRQTEEIVRLVHEAGNLSTLG